MARLNYKFPKVEKRLFSINIIELSFKDLFISTNESKNIIECLWACKKKIKKYWLNKDYVTLASKEIYFCDFLKNQALKAVLSDVADIAKEEILFAKKDLILAKRDNVLLIYNLTTMAVYEIAFGDEISDCVVSKNSDKVAVGTVKTQGGPGDLFILDAKDLKINHHSFNENIETVFGIIKAFPRQLTINDDGTRVLVACMDKLYFFDDTANLIWRNNTVDWCNIGKPIAPKPPLFSSKEDKIKYIAGEMTESFASGFEKGTPIDQISFFNGSILISSQEGHIYNIDYNKNLTWRFPREYDRYKHYSYEFGISPSQKNIFATYWSGEGRALCLSSDGKLLWEDKVKDTAIYRNISFSRNEDLVAFSTRAQRFYIFDMSGKKLLETRCDRVNTMVNFYEDLLLVSDSKFKIYRIVPENKESLGRNDDMIGTQAEEKIPYWTYPNIRTSSFSKAKKGLVTAYCKPEMPDTNLLLEGKIEEFRASYAELKYFDIFGRLSWEKTIKAYSAMSDPSSVCISEEGDVIVLGMFGKGLAYDPAYLHFYDHEGNLICEKEIDSNPGNICYQSYDHSFLVYTYNSFCYKFSKSGEEISKIKYDNKNVNKFFEYKDGKNTYEISEEKEECYICKINGKVSWTLKTSFGIEKVFYSVDKTKAILQGYNIFQCIKLDDGSILWEKQAKGRIENSHFIETTGILVFKCKNEIYCIDCNGVLLWQKVLAEGSRSINNLLESDLVSSRLLVGYGDSYEYQILVLDLPGNEVFKFTTENFIDADISNDGETLFLLANHKVSLFKI